MLINETIGDIMSDSEQVKHLTQIIYILQAASFIVGITFIVGFVIDILKKDEAKGTLAESHIEWQMNTFIYAVIGLVASWLVSMVIPSLAYVFYVVVALWVIARIVKGWVALSHDEKIEAKHLLI